MNRIMKLKIRQLADNSPVDDECIVGESYDCYDCKWFFEENGTLEGCRVKEIVEDAEIESDI